MSAARAGVLLALLLLASVPGTATADDEPAEVRLRDNRKADAQYVAVSLQGDSEADVAASGDGEASGLVAVSGLGDAGGLVAATGTGSSAGLLAASAAGPAAGLVAISGLGNAQSDTLPFSVAGECNRQDCVDVALGTGASAYYLAYSHPHTASAEYAAASTQGSADCQAVTCAAASVQDNAYGTVAASATDRAAGSVAASGFGTADGQQAAASGMGDAEATAAAAGTGSADGSLEVSGCDSVGTVEDPLPVDVPVFVTSRACADGTDDLLP